MYAGHKVEEADVLDLFDHPAHPYTRGLLASIARGRAGARARRLAEIPGMVPSLREPIPGCAFAPRCALASDVCRATAPTIRDVTTGAAPHLVACHHAEQAVVA